MLSHLLQWRFLVTFKTRNEVKVSSNSSAWGPNGGESTRDGVTHSSRDLSECIIEKKNRCHFSISIIVEWKKRVVYILYTCPVNDDAADDDQKDDYDDDGFSLSSRFFSLAYLLYVFSTSGL